MDIIWILHPAETARKKPLNPKELAGFHRASPQFHKERKPFAYANCTKAEHARAVFIIVLKIRNAPAATFSAFCFDYMLMLLCIGGCIGCLATGFHIPAYHSLLSFGILLSCLLITFLYYAAKHSYGWILSAAVILLMGVWVWFRIENLVFGFLSVAAIVFQYLCWGFRGLSMPNLLTSYRIPFQKNSTEILADSETMAEITEVLLFLAIALCLLFGFLYTMNRLFLAAALLPLPIFVLCFLIINATMPALWALCLLLLYWLFLLFTHHTIRLQPRAAAAQAGFLLIPSLLLLFALYTVFPQTPPVSDVMSHVYNSTLDFLASAEEAIMAFPKNVGNFTSTLFHVSAEGNEISFDQLGARHYTGRTVMKVYSDTPGVVYLRENTYNLYTDTGWSYVPPDGENPEVSEAVFAASSNILRTCGMPMSVLSISGARSSLLFTPYYYDEATVSSAPNRDRNVQNIDRSDSYSITYYHFPGSFSALQSGGLKMQELQMVLSIYEDEVYNCYTQIDPVLADTLRAHLTEIGIINADASWDTVSAITEYVRQSAQYALDAEKAPRGSDFVTWFLLEADKGYCTYFATAEVMLLRACGIPARLAAGFLVNITQANRETSVYDSNAHAWTEVFDARLGWIPVEATPPSSAAAISNETNSAADRSDSPTSASDHTVTVQTDTGIGEMPDSSAAEPYDSTDTAESDTPHAASTDNQTDDNKPSTNGDNNSSSTDIEKTRSNLTIPRGLYHAALYALFLLLLLAAVLLFVFHRRQKHKKWLAHLLYDPPKEDTVNETALQLYRLTLAAARAAGIKLPDSLHALAEKAQFSSHTLTDSELSCFRVQYTQVTAQLQKQEKPLSIAALRHRFIDLLY